MNVEDVDRAERERAWRWRRVQDATSAESVALAREYPAVDPTTVAASLVLVRWRRREDTNGADDHE